MTDTSTLPAPPPAPAPASAAVVEALHAKLETRGPRSMQGLADTLGRERTWVHRRLTGKAELGLDDAVRFAQLLDVNLAELLPRKPRRSRGV